MSIQMKHLKIQEDNKIKKFVGKASLLIDKARLKLVETIPSEELKLKFAIKIKADSLKLRAIVFLSEEFDKVELAETIKDDDKKIKAIDNIDNIQDKVSVIKTIKDNNKKIEAIDGYTDIYVVEDVLNTIDVFKKMHSAKGLYELLENAKNKNQTNTIEYIKEEIKKAENLKRIIDDDEKIAALDEIESEYLKAEVVKTIQNDNKKIKILSDFNNDWSKAIIVQKIKDDTKKIEALHLFSSETYKYEVAKTIDDDAKKIEVISLFKDNIAKRLLVQTIKDNNKKIELLPSFKDDITKAIIIETIKDDDKIIEAFSFFENDEYIEENISLIKSEDKRLEMILNKFSYQSLEKFIEQHKESEIEKNPKFQELKKIYKKAKKGQTARDDNKKIEIIDSIDNENLKVEIIKTINDSDKIIEYIDKIQNENLKLQIIESIKDNEKKLDVIQKLTPKQLKKFRNNSEDISFIKDNVEIFIKNEGFEGKVSQEVIEELYEKNNQVVKNIDFRILNPKYIELLGEEKINLISCYHDIQEEVLGLDDKGCYIFSKCIDSYMEKMQTDEWTVLGQGILENMSKGEYSDLMESIENVEELSRKDIEILTRMLQDDNWCKITNISEARDFDTIRKDKCNSIMQNEKSTIEQKKEALIQKIFGHNLEYAKSIIEKFGEDIENIADGDEKDYVRALKLIQKIKNPEILQEIYDECEFVQTDKTLVERALKNEYGKMFNEGLYKPKEEDLVKGYSNVYNAGVDFKIIMTSIGAYNGEKESKNHKEDWNRPVISTQHFCASYIRNDMIGTAPISDICYGFSEMKEDSLMLSGNHDIYSNSNSFNSLANREKYYTPDNQINNTTKYNEMDFRRIQGGEKKQPDYIIVFRKNGIIPNMLKAQKASKQWGDMPIVIVDIDECLKSEKEKVNEMLKEYKEDPTFELENKIKQKVRNNRVTNRNFGNGVDEKLNGVEHEEYEQEVKKEEKPKIKVTEEALEENYEKVTPNERKSEMSKIKKLYTRMKEIARGEEHGK